MIVANLTFLIEALSTGVGLDLFSIDLARGVVNVTSSLVSLLVGWWTDS